MWTILLPIVWLYSFPNIKILSKPRSWYSNLTILVKNEWRFLPLRAIDSESVAESFPIHRNIDPDTSTMQMIPLVKTPFHRNNSSPINMPSEIGHIPTKGKYCHLSRIKYNIYNDFKTFQIKFHHTHFQILQSSINSSKFE